MVMLSFFDTLLNLHCEDIMLELLLKYLIPGKHVPISYRHKINHVDPYINSIEFFLNLTPDIMKHSANIHNLRKTTITPSSSSSAVTDQNDPITTSFSKTIGANWNHYGLHSGDSLYSNYYAYLFDAHQKIQQCYLACSQWSNEYKYNKPMRKSNYYLNEKTTELIRNFYQEFSDIMPSNTAIMQSTTATVATTGATAVTSATNTIDAQNLLELEKSNKFDSLQSTGESSGYESFKWRPDDESELATGGNNHLHDDISDNSHKKSSCGSGGEPLWKISSRKESLMTDLDFSEDIFAQGTVTLGK